MDNASQEPSSGNASAGVRRDEDQQRQRRLEALNRLASDSRQSSDSPQFYDKANALIVAPRRQFWLRWQFWLSMLLIVSVAATFVWKRSTTPPPGHRQPAPVLPIQIFPRADDMGCPRDMALLPHGRLMAVLGYELSCPSSGSYSSGMTLPTDHNMLFYAGPLSHVPGLVNIYNADTGSLVKQLHPDASIVPLIKLPTSVVSWLASAGETPDVLLGINYTHVLWSPDGQHVAVTFTLYVPSGPATGGVLPGEPVDGVLITDRDGKHPRVLTRPADRSRPTMTVWDTATGTALQSPVGTAGTLSTFATIPLAQSFRWTHAGTLNPLGTLSPDLASSTSRDLVGPTSDGTTFALWQPGTISDAIPPTQAGDTGLSGVSIYEVDFAAWSPDGRYIAERASVMGLLTSPMSSRPDDTALARYGWQNAPLLPIRDAGLQTAIVLADKYSFGMPHLGSPYGAVVAWRPDGRALAVDASQPDHSVAILDCASGKQVAALVPPAAAGAPSTGQDGANVLRWSPDGTRLALYDTAIGLLTILLTIWSDGQLPQ